MALVQPSREPASNSSARWLVGLGTCLRFMFVPFATGIAGAKPDLMSEFPQTPDSHFAGTFATSSLASMNRASSSALDTVSTSSFARINLQARCQWVRTSRFLSMEVI
jgi:hypothetical protein